MRLRVAGIVLLLCANVPATPARAADSGQACTNFIATVPAVIDHPGVWCLAADLSSSSSGAAIRVDSAHVVLDCLGHRLEFAVVPPSPYTTVGIGTAAGNTTVRHCDVRGFDYGILVDGYSGVAAVTVEDNRIEDSRVKGIWVGMDGRGIVLRRNQVLATQGMGGANKGPIAGIESQSGVDILDNTIVGVGSSPDFALNAYGILRHDDSLGGIIAGNRVRGVRPGAGRIAYGIYLANVQDIVLRGNDLHGDGATADVGIRCGGAGNRVRDSIIDGFATPLSNCGDAGGNDLGP